MAVFLAALFAVGFLGTVSAVIVGIDAFLRWLDAPSLPWR